MDQVSYEALTEKLGQVTLMNKQLRRANISKEKENKHLRRIIKKMKEDAAKERKPNYKNGKRGGKFNG
jgi:hypothetical protein